MSQAPDTAPEAVLGQQKGSHWGGRSHTRGCHRRQAVGSEVSPCVTKLTNVPASPKGATAFHAVTLIILPLWAQATRTQLAPSGSELP